VSVRGTKARKSYRIKKGELLAKDSFWMGDGSHKKGGWYSEKTLKKRQGDVTREKNLSSDLSGEGAAIRTRRKIKLTTWGSGRKRYLLGFWGFKTRILVGEGGGDRTVIPNKINTHQESQNENTVHPQTWALLWEIGN